MIAFSDKQWERVYANYRRWWKGKLGRPILPIILHGKDPGRPEPKIPQLVYGNIKDFSITAEQIIDRMDYDMSCNEYLMDAYPYAYMANFGAGVTAAFLGAKVESANDTVWFLPPDRYKMPSELTFKYDEGNIWLNRVKDIYRAGMKRWGGSVIMGMVDLSGIMDVLSMFCGTENLLLALYDEPEEVKRCVNELQKLWFRFYDEINDILKGSWGYTDWAGILYEKPSYMQQSDFSYMIGSDMFAEFVLPELESSAARFDRSFYHLDGQGQLPHLQYLLKSEHIAGIQWVPGVPESDHEDWSEVYKKISAAGKKIQMSCRLDKYYDEILPVIEHPDDLCKLTMHYSMSEKSALMKKLRNYL